MAAHLYGTTSKISESSTESSDESIDIDRNLSISTKTRRYHKLPCTHDKKPDPSIPRLPTRRPDPNVCNRNALLARENRRKKKAYVEALEKEISKVRSVNRKLHKLLKKHIKLVGKLEQEKQYYEGLVSNSSEILDWSSSLVTDDEINKGLSPSSTGAESSPTISYSYEDDTDSTSGSHNYVNWDELLSVKTSTSIEELKESESDVQGEHNYFKSDLFNVESSFNDCGSHIPCDSCTSCLLYTKCQSIQLPDQILT